MSIPEKVAAYRLRQGRLLAFEQIPESFEGSLATGLTNA
jgi:hypothetical protein